MNATEENRIPAESIDHRLNTIRQELERIYAAQNELLPQVHPSLREDFCMARADRIRAMKEEEMENHSLLRAWIATG